jgi:hypothetical protein
MPHRVKYHIYKMISGVKDRNMFWNVQIIFPNKFWLQDSFIFCAFKSPAGERMFIDWYPKCKFRYLPCCGSFAFPAGRAGVGFEELFFV